MENELVTAPYLEKLQQYFPSLSSLQQERFAALPHLYAEWNEKINVISRKDIANIGIHHILHSLGIAKVIRFTPETSVLDVGTGGGFPGIPLAIMFPESNFYLVDSIGKKIKVVQAIATDLGLENVRAEQMRAENIAESFDFVVSRAVTALPVFYQWVKNKFAATHRNAIPNGILYLKGGNINAEVNSFGKRITRYPLSNYFEEDFFETKQVVHLSATRAR